MVPRSAVPALAFPALLACFALIARHFGVAVQLPTALSFALLLAPYWAFGFGFDTWLRAHTGNRFAKLLAPLSLLAAYLIYALPLHRFRWLQCLGMAAVVLAISLLLQHAASTGAPADKDKPDWRDWLVLAILGISVEFRFFNEAWPGPGLSGMPKLLFVDAGLYGYLVLRPISGIGFDFRIRLSDIEIGLREFLFFTPAALLLGFALRFLHFHATFGTPFAFAAGWLFTLFFVAMPEEIFFRGLMLNMLERRLGTNRALAVTSLLFGLAHFNKRAAYFNWRYVILATIAGVFYGRAWLARRRLVASSIAHATVDTVWSIWLR
jgi:membrane protease YdiL (CAAX protease family)